MPAPNNEAILIEIEKSEQNIRQLLKKLLELNATPQTLASVAEVLRHISYCYFEHSNIGAGAAGAVFAAPRRECSRNIEVETIHLPAEVEQKIIEAIEKHKNSQVAESEN